jgi:hypothetical protein
MIFVIGPSTSAQTISARRGPVSAVLRGAWQEGGPDRPLCAHDRSPRAVLPLRGGAAGRPGACRGKQGGAHQEHGALLPASRDLKKIEGYRFTLRAQRNSRDSVRIVDEAAVPKCYCRIDARIDGVIWEIVLSLLPGELAKTLESSVQETPPNADAIRAAAMQNEQVPGAEVRRGSHLRLC